MCRRLLPLFALALLLCASGAFAQGAATCQEHGVNPSFGPNVPYQSAQWVDGKCYCGVKDGVTPQQAKKNGWYASCDNGKCICNFTQGTFADNDCCMVNSEATPALESCQPHGVDPTFGPSVPYKSSAWVDGKCYCGVKAGITPKQAQDAGWYASCNNGKCVCNFTKGTVASNACCKP